MGRRFYVDVHASANGRRGVRARPHIVFDGDKCVRMASLIDIPAVEGDEVYVDVVPPTMYEDVSALLRRGVRVFRLRRTDHIAAYRDRLSLPKNDAKTLSTIDGEYFVEATEAYVELMKLIDEYYKHLNILKLMRQFEASAEAVKPIRRDKDRLARQIISMAKTTLNKYDETCRKLGLTYKSLYGKVALADLLIHVDFTAGLRKILCYVGHYKPSNGRYNHRLRTAVQSLAISHYRKHKVKAREARQLLKTIKQTIAGGPA
ncbi:MAG: hypothetical protein QXM16_04960 [Nitrososphaerota archaeon]